MKDKQKAVYWASRTGRLWDQAQEKPDLQELPHNAPLGALEELPEEIR